MKRALYFFLLSLSICNFRVQGVTVMKPDALNLKKNNYVFGIKFIQNTVSFITSAIWATQMLFSFFSSVSAAYLPDQNPSILL